ncbi:Zn-dependent hydrolase [Halostagnicola sp. A-GB9-2]|uniref:Zn-dependent hydrolase n=1 Tax=Halostagnicola sp. A-GB9-2 TaxID=3048066 RepID=UPI0024BFAE64|nr:Zn-dependent hydrolase [Halostagnicola sp. A-GB9-2]MDJ1434216.1 Zn-dependent hydrolase [Halostagnicola sp. A-GB9-2]
MNVDAERLRADIERNATFGALDVECGRGRTVLTGSEADRLARERLVDRLTDAGLTVRIDRVGNIAGYWVPDSADEDTAPVVLGSHLDSVPRGGIFDGPLGVYGAFEAIRAIQSSEYEPTRPLGVGCFTEEEGARFGVGTLGSSVAAGKRSAVEALSLTDDAGVTLEQRLTNIGFSGTDEIDAAEWSAWLELHIEQGTRLTDAGAAVGIVDSVTGLTNCEVTITGEANHAGTTAMADRTDALAAASEFVLEVEAVGRSVAAEHSTAVVTVGEGSIEPNARNIVPGAVTLQLDIRDVDCDRMDDLVAQCRDCLFRVAQDRAVETSFERYRDTEPTHLSQRCLAASRTAATTTGAQFLELHSAAMHDTATVADVTDSGLLFAPSKDGISHNPREWTSWEDCAAAVTVLAESAAALATE